MTTSENPAPREWDEEYEVALAALKQAERDEDRPRQALSEIKIQHEREQRLARLAQKKASEASGSEREARRKVEDANREAQRARLDDRPRQRFDADARRWTGEAGRSAQDARRFEDEARRKERVLSSLNKEIQVRQAELAEQTQLTRERQNKVNYLMQTAGSRAADPSRSKSQPPQAEAPSVESGSAETEAPAGDGTPLPETDPTHEDEPAQQDSTGLASAAPAESDQPALKVTHRATGALKGILDGMGPEPNQALRLVEGPDGGFSLALDMRRAGDQVLSHQGTAVLLVGAQSAGSFAGKTLDVSETDQGTQITLAG